MYIKKAILRKQKENLPNRNTESWLSFFTSPAEVNFKILQIQTKHDSSGGLKKGTQGCQVPHHRCQTSRFMVDKQWLQE